jgi:hypothetical protein
MVMAFEIEKREARRILGALEDGTLNAQDTRRLIDDADPALVALIFGWVRARYGPGHPMAQGVLGRVVEVCAFPSVPQRIKKGEKDSIVQWFKETYDWGDLERDAFIDLVVEKLEG